MTGEWKEAEAGPPLAVSIDNRLVSMETDDGSFPISMVDPWKLYRTLEREFYARELPQNRLCFSIVATLAGFSA